MIVAPRPPEEPRSALRPSVPRRPAGAAPGAVRVNATQVDVVDDDAFLMDLEVALSHPQAHELRPFDALTPDEQAR